MVLFMNNNSQSLFLRPASNKYCGKECFIYAIFEAFCKVNWFLSGINLEIEKDMNIC